MGRDRRNALRLGALRRAFIENAARVPLATGFAIEGVMPERADDLSPDDLPAAEARAFSRPIKSAEARTQG